MKTGTIGWKEINLICQAIAGELVLDDLLARLREALLSSMKARRVLLLLLEKDGYLVAVEAVPDNSQLTYIPFTKLEKPVQTMINQVIGTRQKAILTERGITYVVVPLLQEGRLAGICYLEIRGYTEESGEKLEAILGQTAVSLINARRFAEIQDQARLLEGEEAYRRLLQQKMAERTAEIQQTAQQLKTTQDQLIVQENLASLGSLASGVAQEIKDPLNIINNLAALSVELTQELRHLIEQHDELLAGEAGADILDIINNMELNDNKIQEQSQRADSIVRGMLRHSRDQVGDRELSNIHELLDEAINLAYHGAQNSTIECDIEIEKAYDATVPPIPMVSQDIARVLLNVMSNACYAVQDKYRDLQKDYEPIIRVTTHNEDEWIEIRIRDNGYGIAEEDFDLIFAPFYTTKPAGQGTGLGLSLSYNIVVQGHQGKIEVESELDNYTEFIIRLPK